MDNIVVVGGLVPSVLIPKESLSEAEDAHIGTMDLDLGLALVLLNSHRYEDLTLRLRRAGFEPDLMKQGIRRFNVGKSNYSVI